MADRIKKIKVKQADGNYSDYISIGADAKDIDFKHNGSNVEKTLKKKPYYFNNIEEMKNCEELQVGDMAITLGYYEENDGGGATYRIRTKTENDVEDNSTLLELQNSLVADLIVHGERITMCQLGYMPDNVTQDCHDVIDKYNAICKRDNRKYELFFPRGRWYFSETDIYNYEHPRAGVIFTGVSPQVSEDTGIAQTVIRPFKDNQEYIWNLGVNRTSATLVGNYKITNFCFSCGGGGESATYKKGFCKVALLLTTCCYSYFDGLYFQYFNGTGLCIQTGWENYFGYLNFRLCGYITKDFTYSCIWFKPNPTKTPPSAISACYFHYINFERFSGNCFYIEEKSNCVHCEVNNIQIEWSYQINKESGLTVTELSSSEVLWDDESENIEHIYMVKGNPGVLSYNPLCFNTVSISSASTRSYKVDWIDDQTGEQKTRYIRLSGVIGCEEKNIRKTYYSPVVMIGNLSLPSSFPIFHCSNADGLQSGKIMVGNIHNYPDYPIQIKNCCWNWFFSMKNNYKNFTQNTNKIIYIGDVNNTNNNLISMCDGSGSPDKGLVVKGKDGTTYYTFYCNGEKIIYVRIYLDYDSVDDFPDNLTLGQSHFIYSDGTDVRNSWINITKSEITDGKYPLKEWFDYQMYAKGLPFGECKVQMQFYTSKLLVDYIKETTLNRTATYSELTSTAGLKSRNGAIVYCTDRRESSSDELGLLVIFDGTTWKSLKGTKIENLIS